MQRNVNHTLTASPTEPPVDFCRTTGGDALTDSVLVVCILRRGTLAPNPLDIVTYLCSHSANKQFTNVNGPGLYAAGYKCDLAISMTVGCHEHMPMTAIKN